MAIKPNDCILPYGKLYHWERLNESDWESHRVWDVKYMEKFYKHLQSLYKHADFTDPDALKKIRTRELAKYSAVFKRHKSDRTKDYIKFKTHSALTMFILRWS